MDNRPIGVFDSGLGGLTGVRELRKRLPHEEIIYFGINGEDNLTFTIMVHVATVLSTLVIL